MQNTQKIYTEDYEVNNYIVYDTVELKYGYVRIEELEKYNLKRLNPLEEKELPEVNIEGSHRIFSIYNDKKYLHKKYNKLTVDFFCVQFIDNMYQFRWMCSCDCTSKPKPYRPDKVVNGKAKSCGCQGKYADKKYIGKIIHGVKVVGIDTDRISYEGDGLGWILECPGCHEIFLGAARKVVRGNIKSCGNLDCKRIVHVTRAKYNRDGYIEQVFGYLKVKSIDYGETHYSHSSMKSVIWNCECLNCGKEISLPAISVVRGNNASCGCLTSIHEIMIMEILENYNIRYEREVSYPNLYGINGGSLRFDFKIYINDKDYVLLEFQGNQHFERTNNYWNFDDLQEHDERKREFCKDNNIILIELSGRYTKKQMEDELMKLGIIA